MSQSGYRQYDKKQRNENLLKYRREHPGITIRALAKIFKISRARVHQILKAHESTNLKAEA